MRVSMDVKNSVMISPTTEDDLYKLMFTGLQELLVILYLGCLVRYGRNLVRVYEKIRKEFQIAEAANDQEEGDQLLNTYLKLDKENKEYV